MLTKVIDSKNMYLPIGHKDLSEVIHDSHRGQINVL